MDRSDRFPQRRAAAAVDVHTRALAMWPGLDRRKLARASGDPERIARLIERRTALPRESIIGNSRGSVLVPGACARERRTRDGGCLRPRRRLGNEQDRPARVLEDVPSHAAKRQPLQFGSAPCSQRDQVGPEVRR